MEIPLQSSEKGFSLLSGSRGPAMRSRFSSDCSVAIGEQTLRHRIPAGTYPQLWLNVVDSPARVTLGRPRIVSPDGVLLWEAPPNAWNVEPTYQPKILPSGALEAGSDSVAPRAILSLGHGLEVRSGREVSILRCGLMAAALTLLLCLLGVLWERPLANAWQRVLVWLRGVGNHPQKTLASVAALAVLLACFPVVFLGKSFLSPSTGGHGIYGKSPPIPGIESAKTEDFKGSDVLVAQVGHRPYSMLAHEAALERGEFPLWNRYNSCGATFVGQSLSMVGDPLHWLTILTDGAAWAWDVKFLVARWLFAFGIGLCVWMATRRISPAAGAAFGAAFLGFFAYRFNHPANIGVCYAPWILLCWQNIAVTRGTRGLAGWALALALACTMLFHSGTAKESSMLLIFMNLSGGLLVLLNREPRRLAFGVAGGLVFTLLNAPFWLSFLDALGKSFTVSEKPPVFQLALGNLIGLFDDLFYQRTAFSEWFTDPSANVLVLAGVLIGVVRIRELLRSPLVRALGLASLIPFALAFGIIPPSVVERIPFIANISHVGNTFSCILIVHALVFAGVAWSASPVRREWPRYLLALATLVALYWAWPLPDPGMPPHLAKAMDFGTGSPFFWIVTPLLLIAVALLPAVQKGTAFFPKLALVCLAGIAVFRHAQWVETTFDFYVMNPQPRPDFTVPSPAVERLRPLLAEPSRVHGIGSAFIPGYSAALRIEHLASADALTSGKVRELTEAAGFTFQWKWRTVLQPEQMAAAQKWTDLFNNRYFLGHRGQTPPATFRPLYSADLDAWESPTAWPRAFFTDRLLAYQTIQDFSQLVERNGRPFAAVQDGAPLPGSGLSVAAKNYDLRTNSTRFDIDAPSPGIAVLTETWFDGDIRVTLNGQPAQAFRVNHAFRGVRIPAPGNYTVEFSYAPRVLAKALWLCAAGALVALALVATALLQRSPLMTEKSAKGAGLS